MVSTSFNFSVEYLLADVIIHVFVEKPLRDIAQGKYLNINLKLLDVRDNVVSNVCV